MNKKKNPFLLGGTALVLLSLALLLASQGYAEYAQRKAADVVMGIEACLPRRTAGIPEPFTNPEMPVLQIGGEDFCGLLEFPAYGRTLPVYDTWDTGKLSRYPCRFFGSVNAGPLLIGGSGQKGQLDFCGQLPNGAVVILTDMSGAEFHYTLARIDRSQKVPAEKLMNEEFDLTVFLRDTKSLDYLLLRCKLG